MDILIELAARDPGGLDYQVFRFEDGVGFLHVAVFDGTTDPFEDCGAHLGFTGSFSSAWRPRRLSAAPC